MTPAHDQSDTREITLLLRRAAEGDGGAFDQLLPLVYDHLKVLARRRLAPHRGHTLTPTALVHEAYLKLVDHTAVEWQSRAHFFAIASSAMRQILIDYARTRQAAKRGGGATHLPLDEGHELSIDEHFFADGRAEELLALNDALDRLASFDERGAKVVQYRFFGGLTNRETADVLGASEVTIRRAWTMAKTWLRAELNPPPLPKRRDPRTLGAPAGDLLRVPGGRGPRA